MIRTIVRRFGKIEFYALRGIISSDFEILDFLILNLKKELKRRGGYSFRIDPDIELVERDADGKIVPGGYNNYALVSELLKLGFKKSRYEKNMSQVTWQDIIPLKGRTEDELLKAMTPTKRRRIKQNAYGIYVRELTYAEIESVFYKIMEETTEHRHFVARSLEYYQRMYKAFSRKECFFVAAMINPHLSYEKINGEIKDLEKRALKSDSRQSQNRERIESLRRKIEKLEGYFPGLPDTEIPLAAEMMMTTDGREMLNLFGGNSTKYMELDAQYVIQWELIRKALREGYDRYNFHGIPENVDPNFSDYGVFEFKRGFNGKVIELIGEFELPLSGYYYVQKVLSRVKKK